METILTRKSALMALMVFVIATAVEAAPADAACATTAEPRDRELSFPRPSKDQSRQRGPRPVADRDNGSCLVNMRCYCTGPLDTWGGCTIGADCRESSGGYCMYDCYSFAMCHTVTDAYCEDACGCNSGC